MENRRLSTYKNIICPICLEAVEQTGKGRPRQYHETCRRFEQLASWMEEIIPKLEVGTAGVKKIRSRVWYLANLTNTLAPNVETKKEERDQ